ncbi:MAG: pimeloyl-ACP methyl ester esterase BioH [Casimicrobiaceae bacterium]
MSVHIESAGRGAPLVLLHGWAMHGGLWQSVLPRLIGRFRVHNVDLPGHGWSPGVTPYTLEALVEAVASAVAALPDLRHVPVTVLGWSLGGLIALEWARTRPVGVRALVLTATTPCFVQRDDWPHAMAAATLDRFDDELVASYRLTLQRFLSLQMQGSERSREALAQMRSTLFARGEPTPADLRDALAVLATTDLRRVVADIAQSALIIVGDRDALTPLAASRWLAAALPKATLVTLAGAGHAPFISHPDAFVAALDRFADEH